MNAKYNGKCGVCGLPYSKGDAIKWSRQPATVLPHGGRIYHVTCSVEPYERTAPKPAPAVSAKPDLSPTALAELIARLLAKETAPAAVAEEEPEASDYVPAAPAATVKPKQASTPKVKLSLSSPWWIMLQAVLPFVRRILLIGPPSSGKSTTALIVGGLKHRVTNTETTSREDLIGMHHLIGGETKFVPVNYTVAMAKGEGLLSDEIDRQSPETASLQYSLIDDKPHVNLPTGELVEAADGYKVLMTTNETIETLPLAIQDRIEVIIMASTPHEDALKGEGITDGMRAVCQRYYKALPVPPVKMPPTVRRMRTFGKLIANGIPNDVAAALVFGAAGAREVLSAITSAETGAK